MEHEMSNNNEQQLNDYIAISIQNYGMEYTADNYLSLRDQYYSMKYPSQNEEVNNDNNSFCYKNKKYR